MFSLKRHGAVLSTLFSLFTFCYYCYLLHKCLSLLLHIYLVCSSVREMQGTHICVRFFFFFLLKLSWSVCCYSSRHMVEETGSLFQSLHFQISMDTHTHTQHKPLFSRDLCEKPFFFLCSGCVGVSFFFYYYLIWHVLFCYPKTITKQLFCGRSVHAVLEFSTSACTKEKTHTYIDILS